MGLSIVELYLVRHTIPAIAKGICYGHSDIDVAGTFDDELALLRNKIALRPETAIYSSPSQRCLKLANIIAGEHSVQQDERLMELNFGEWELQHWNDIPRGSVDVWAQDHVEQAPPKGESFQALHLRAQSFLEEISNDDHVEAALIFTHAGVIRAMLAEALQLPLVHAFRLQVDYASVSQIVVEGGITRVAYVNR